MTDLADVLARSPDPAVRVVLARGPAALDAEIARRAARVAEETSAPAGPGPTLSARELHERAMWTALNLVAECGDYFRAAGDDRLLLDAGDVPVGRGTTHVRVRVTGLGSVVARVARAFDEDAGAWGPWRVPTGRAFGVPFPEGSYDPTGISHGRWFDSFAAALGRVVRDAAGAERARVAAFAEPTAEDAGAVVGLAELDEAA